VAATLRELATEAFVPEPLLGLFDLGDERRWRRSLARLVRLGHSTGRAYAVGAATAALAIGSGTAPAAAHL
jgi:hypothetical protein